MPIDVESVGEGEASVLVTVSVEISDVLVVFAVEVSVESV